jgi:hypothetical protein
VFQKVFPQTSDERVSKLDAEHLGDVGRGAPVDTDIEIIVMYLFVVY